MKLKSAAPLFLLLALASPAVAETTTSYLEAGTCPMTGDLSGLTEDCLAFRLAFRAEVTACMEERLLASRTSHGAVMNSQSTRARFLICDAEVRAKLGVPSK